MRPRPCGSSEQTSALSCKAGTNPARHAGVHSCQSRAAAAARAHLALEVLAAELQGESPRPLGPVAPGEVRASCPPAAQQSRQLKPPTLALLLPSLAASWLRRISRSARQVRPGLACMLLCQPVGLLRWLCLPAWLGCSCAAGTRAALHKLLLV